MEWPTNYRNAKNITGDDLAPRNALNKFNNPQQASIKYSHITEYQILTKQHIASASVLSGGDQATGSMV